jgi:hypothetical protein
MCPRDYPIKNTTSSSGSSTSINSNRVSAITASNENNRWSAISSLRSSWYPSRLKATSRTAEVAPATADLQVVSQQHYGPDQNYSPSEHHQEALHRFPSIRLSTM